MAGKRIRSVPRWLAAVAERFGDVDAADCLAVREVGDGTADAEDPGIAAGRQPHRFRGLGEKPSAGFVGRGDGIEQCAIRLRIRADRVVAVTVGLDRPGRGNAGGDFGRAFGRWRQDQVGGADRLDVDVQVDPVEQWPGHLRLIICGALRGSRAGKARIAEMAAPTRVHRRDQLDASGERDVCVGAGDADRTGFQRLAQRIEDGALELRQFVEKQHAEMRKADLARLHLQSPCGKLPFRCTKRQSRLINDAHSAALYRTFRCTASALRSGGLR